MLDQIRTETLTFLLLYAPWPYSQCPFPPSLCGLPLFIEQDFSLGIAAQPWGHIVSSVVDRDPNVLNLDPDPGFWPNFDPNPGFCFNFE